MHSSTGPEKIGHIKHLREELYTAEKELFATLHREQMVEDLHVEREQKGRNSNVTVLMIASVCMILFVLSGTGIQPNMSESYTTIPPTIPQPINPADCAKNDDDFDACVAGQRQGSGCSWYATCSKCIPDADRDNPAICNQ